MRERMNRIWYDPRGAERAPRNSPAPVGRCRETAARRLYSSASSPLRASRSRLIGSTVMVP
jgi:hypothetical protein